MAALNSDQTNENTLIDGANVISEPIADIANVLQKLSNILGTSESSSVSETTTSSKPKSSTEIISELFGAFNAEPPILTDIFHDHPDDDNINSNLKSSSSPDLQENALSARAKTIKKKHKHKSKKHKKRLKSNKDPLPHSRTSKRSSMKHTSSTDYSIKTNSTVNEETITINDLDPIEDQVHVRVSIAENPSQSEDLKTPAILSSANSGADADSNPTIKINSNNIHSTDDGERLSTNKGNIISCKATSKISIKNLKFSSVFEATLKEVEEQAKAKAEMYEEGEISNSSDDVLPHKNGHVSDEPTSIPSINISSSPIIKISTSKSCSKRHRSPSPHRKSSSNKRVKDSKKESSRRAHRSSDETRHGSHRHREKKRSTRSRSGGSRSTKKVENGHKSRSRERTNNNDRNKNKPHDLREKLTEKHKNGHSHRRRSEEKHEHSKRRRDHSTSPIDKKKLMAIARKNALFLLQQGALPGPIGQEKIVTIKAGGKSVAELTDFCKRLSKKEAKIGGSEGENEDDSDSDVEKRPFNHPFQIKERPLSITMNIRNSVPVPANALLNKASDQTLRVQFPVSSGTQHRKTESEWVPVEPKIPAPKQLLAITASAEPLPVPQPVPAPQVFPELSTDPPKDIGNIVSERLRAMRKLQENPSDVQALSAMYHANLEMQTWAESKQLPGQFTGSTGVRMLSVAELSAGAHAYVRKDQFLTAAPVSGGMGMSLLQKMGWRPGEGLGKNKGGSLEPLSLEIKMDKKGLVTREDLKQHSNPRAGGRINTNNKTLSDKHPISLLIEFCSRRRWKTPCFEITHESGPDHKKNFLFKVQVNGVNYEPATTSPNKKLAKAEAATVCLRALGVPID